MTTSKGIGQGKAAAGQFSINMDEAALNKLFNSEEGPVARELAKRALKAERAAKRLAPVDTGRLRASITWRFEHDAEGLFVAIGTNVGYALPQEFGTGRMPAHPFLRPALYEAAK
jgi:HK97 gp10 family phage protein